MKRIVILVIAILALGTNANASGIRMGETFQDTIRQYGDAAYVKKGPNGDVKGAVFEKGMVMVAVAYQSGRATSAIYRMKGSKDLPAKVVKEYLCVAAGVRDWPKFDLNKGAWVRSDPFVTAVFLASKRDLMVMDRETVKRLLDKSKSKSKPKSNRLR